MSTEHRQIKHNENGKTRTIGFRIKIVEPEDKFTEDTLQIVETMLLKHSLNIWFK